MPRLPLRSPRRPHGLGVPLIVSLTSHPRRFPQLPLTLASLAAQTLTPDALLLWIAHGDRPALTAPILRWRRRGVQIRCCDDLRSFNKIIPTLVAFPGCAVVTADDDIDYAPTWLEALVEAARRQPGTVICHRAHTIRLDPCGVPLPYEDWQKETAVDAAAPLTFPTGVCGVLYPPGCLAEEVTDAALFRRLCPEADDLWLYWMMRRRGTLARRLPGGAGLRHWPGSQEHGLYLANNFAGGNSRQLRQLLEHFGAAIFEGIPALPA